MSGQIRWQKPPASIVGSPVSSGPSDHLIEPELAQRFTGQSAIRSIAQAEAGLRAAEDHLAQLSKQRRSLRWKFLQTGAQATIGDLRNFLSTLPERIGLDAWLISLGLSLCISLVAVGVTFFLTPSSLPLLLTAALSPFAIVGFTPWFFVAQAGQVEIRRRKQTAVIDRDWAKLKLSKLAQDWITASSDVIRKRQLVNGLRQAEAFPVQQLLRVNFAALGGSQFESFLGDVFRVLGYRVQLTGQSGDQGVDILIEIAGERIAVQAKRYQGSVGNAAVQQAFAGQRFYNCHRCAVVTSSTFTRSAQSLAHSTNCRLIDGSQIHSLIRGHIRL